MGMFCYQCQEASRNTGCTVKGVCGKDADTAKLQDLLVYVAREVAVLSELNDKEAKVGSYLTEALFITITNANFDKQAIRNAVISGVRLKSELIKDLKANGKIVPASMDWVSEDWSVLNAKAEQNGVLAVADEDKRSLIELLTYGLKGMAAYAYHAAHLSFPKPEVTDFIVKGLAATLNSALTVDELLKLVMECGEKGVTAMATLDEANTKTYGNPEITQVNIGVRNNPGILVSGHDLKDLEQLLIQTEGTGVDVYTHSEMLPAHYYPNLKKYKHLAGNYGNAWWKQADEFEKFGGPILFTTNCIVPPRDTYKGRMFTTGPSGYEGVKHIPEGSPKDFSEIIALAKTCPSPTQIESGTITGGFAHAAVMSVADKVVDGVKSGAIRKFVVMAGCDGRVPARNYYTEFANGLPKDVVILTAGCAKYRYNKLNLGDIGGIPRVLDAGQCNDSYSLAVIALKLKEVFGLDDINKLPIVYNIAWYEQKAVIVLLALLYLGVKNIHLGPTLPAFLTPNTAKVLVELFGISGIGNVEEDLKSMVG